jgi:ABC-type transport system involved in multi-copper enzyme maturation permease subunit
MDLPNTALFMRSLRMDNRHWQTYLLRIIMLFLIGFTLFVYFAKDMLSAQMTAPGLEFFKFISFLNLFFITVVGVTLFSSAITEEKEVDSLNLLLMTGLTPFTMLLSKSTSKLLVGLMLIFAQFPFSILSVTLGGVSLHQVFSVYVTLFAYTIFVGNLALFFSVICARTYKAATWTFAVLLFFHILSGFVPVVANSSPFVRTSRILTTGFKDSIFCEQVWTNLGSAVILFLLSVLIFNYFTRSASSPVISFARNKKWRIFPIPRSWKNAIAWKEFFFTSGGTPGFILTSLLLSLFIGIELLVAWVNNDLSNESIGICLMITGGVFFILESVYMSSTIFNKEREEKTYAMLTLLPVSVRNIAYSKVVGGSLFMLPAIFTVLLGFYFVTDFFRELELGFGFFMGFSIVISMLVQYIFYLYLVTFFSLSIRYGGFVIALLVYLVVWLGLGIPGMLISVIPVISLGVLGNVTGESFFIINAVIKIFTYGFAIFFTSRLIVKRLESLAAA